MTATDKLTIAELAAQSLAAVRVFEEHGIDYCCGGKRPLADVCHEKGYDPSRVMAALETAIAEEPLTKRDWANEPLSELAAHIVAAHHGYLRRELPAIQARIYKLHQIYNERYGPTLVGLPEEFERMKSELELHIQKEEAVLFPAIHALAAAVEANQPPPAHPFGSIANPIRRMEQDHDDAGRSLTAIRAITNHFAIPEHACVTYKALMKSLEALEQDLHMHVHLENNILFPRAIRMEAEHQA